MKILEFLKDKENLIAFDNSTTINRADVSIKNNSLTFKKGNEFFVFLDNYDAYNELEFNFHSQQKIKLFIIVYQNKSIKMDYSFNLDDSVELEVFTNFVSRRKTNNISNFIYNLKENSSLKLLNAITFNGNLDLNCTVNLDGEKSEATIDLLNIGGFSNKHKVRQDVNHQSKYTESYINNWLISLDNSVLDYSVSGFIEKGKEFSKCFQSNKGIMLSDSSQIAVEPKLYIDEYNVEAGHGAAIGQIDELQLYYLLSRGLSETEAKSLIISGYTLPFIDKISDEDIRRHVTSQSSRLIRRKA
ncbi:MAG: SufD family Fe-S cluster assembly protein [Candidatus Izemoplasmatales bacterium]|nr:SufD family Fe-S cluster assembly protein [Candidatus Izemoplasmatales bacterium]